MSRRIVSLAGKVCGWDGRTPRVDNLQLTELAYTRIEKRIKYARKLSSLFMWLLYVQLLGGQNICAFV